jgi:hypothetical protein
LTFSNFFDSLGDLEWVAILVAAVAMFVFAWIWYGPLFGKAWSKATGMPMNSKPDPMGMAKGFLEFFGLSIGVAYFIPALHHMFQNPASFETLIVSSFVLTLFVLAPFALGRVVWEKGKWSLWAIDVGFLFVGIALAAYIQDLMA